MVAIAFFVVIAILRCASAANISTSLLLPSGLFYPEIPLQPPTFVGQVTVTRSTTYYTVECNAGVSAALFNPGFGGPSYTFSENSASTQYIHQYDQDYAEPSAAFSSGAAPSTLDQITLT